LELFSFLAHLAFRPGELLSSLIHKPFHQSLVAIGPVVSEEKIKIEMLTDGRQTKSDDNSSPGELKRKITPKSVR
jgi:hypothetical protein